MNRRPVLSLRQKLIGPFLAAAVAVALVAVWAVYTVAHHHDPERAPNNPLIAVLIAAHARLAAADAA